MKVLITGGAGFLGINLVRYLLKNDIDVVSLDVEPFDYPEKDAIVHVQGDIRDTQKLKEALEGCDTVVHCAAALPLYTPDEIFSIDIDGTKNVLNEALNHGVKRFVHISSTAVYGIPDHHPLLEDDNLFGVGPYGEAKVKAEEICAEFRDRGMCVSILRPKTFIGPERLGVFSMLYEWASEGHNFPILGKGRNLYQYLDVEDLCASIFLCLVKEEEVVNDTFNIGAAEFSTFREDFQSVLDHAGFGKRVIPLPSGPAIMILRFLEKLKLSPLYKWVYETAFKESFVSIEKAQQKLGFKPVYSNEQALIRNFEWYMANKHKFEKSVGISHRVSWSQGILKFAKLIF
jgi:nucleoside-diphosphate-sugar epimerase